jgi:7-cyano-7-deazaguanine synthase
MNADTADGPLAVLVSGGVDSAILLAESALRRVVHPLYLRFGLIWEEVELAHLRRFLDAVAAPNLRPLVILDMPVRDLYGRHWSITGEGVPDALTSDDAVFLPGRNVLFLSKGLLWCHLHKVPTIALALLESNPFPDATPEFFDTFASLVCDAIGGRVEVLLPYRGLSKSEVLQRGRYLPLEWTFSCVRPIGRHCGVCNKCAERRHGFGAAGIDDPTTYHHGGWSCSE